MQDFIANTMNVAIVCCYNNRLLTIPSNASEFCIKYAGCTMMGHKECKTGHLDWEIAAFEKGSPIIYKCHAGLENFVVPVYLDGEYKACVIGGQVVVGEIDETKIRAQAKKLNFNEDEYLETYKRTFVMSEKQFNSITELIFLIANSIITVAYNNAKLTELGLEDKLVKNLALKRFLNRYEISKKLLTPRENEVLKHVVLGKSNSEIAKELFLSVHTVKAHVSSILEKFQVEDRVQLAVKAVREGWV